MTASNSPVRTSPTSAFAGARLHHILLMVSDIEASTSFYHDLLGFEVTGSYNFAAGEEPVLDTMWGTPGTHGRQVLGVFPGNPLEVELIEWKVPRYVRPDDPVVPWRTGVQLLSFAVDDMDQVMAEVNKRGIPHEYEALTFAVGARLVMLNDPDGNKVELIQYP
jgi:catechol 2,3-dioxygenase-like lactoylglutathione lyase family enzyme